MVDQQLLHRNITVTPSAYEKEMLQSTKERMANIKEVHLPRILELLDISKTTHQKFSWVDMDEPVFQPYPSELVFQNFTPGETYKLRLQLFNKDKVSRHVKLEHQDSDYFRVIGPNNAGNKVAQGMSAEFTVSFIPQESKDYNHRLVFVTDRERFEVPIHATGPRAILDFRDEIHLPVCPVKASTERTHFVLNKGTSKAIFTLHTQRPFSVTPSSGTLDVGKGMQVTVDFNPMTVGEHSQDLILHYHTGEDVFISLYGACKELDIHLETNSVLLKKTYISLATVHTVSLTNTSDIPLRYCWTTWPNLQEEALSLLRESSVPQLEEVEEEQALLLSQCESDPTAIHRLPLLSRFLQERRSQAVQDLRLALSDNCITVEPAEGELWPKLTAQFIIVFKPKEAKLYQQTIYCDVTGCKSRLPLTITGEGLGPQLQLSYNLMNMENVFIGDPWCYEVKLINRGLIDAPFRLSSPDTTFGRCFSLSPEEGVVPSGDCQILEVSFHCPILGTFSEDLLLTVTGQREPLTLTFRGCVIGPTFNFSVSDLNFGDVAFGFPKTLTFSLINTSYVPMNFALGVLGDGLGSPSVTWDKQLSDVSRNNFQVTAARDFNARPVEFTVSPAAGFVPSLSRITIKVMLCANTVKTYRLALVVDVEGVGERIRTLPINARCIVPDIVVDTPMLDFQRCFLDHPYEQKVRLINDSNLQACYSVLDQEYEESLSLHCGSSRPRGMIHPHSLEEIAVVLRAKAIGRLRHTLRIAVFGSLQPPLVSGSLCEVVLSCVGQGPAVRVLSQQLNFGQIQVLKDSTRALHLSNQSPIPAHFTARMSHRKSCWRVEPSEGEVPPESQLELRVVAHLKDTLHFEDRLEVSIQHSQTHTVALSAIGTGTTLVSDRPLAPSLDLGTFFSHGSCQYHFTLTNCGQRKHRLDWQTDPDLLPSIQTSERGSFSGRTVLPPISAPRKNHMPGHCSELSSSREKPVFSVSPSYVELFPGCSVDMVLTGSSDSPKVVQERLTCCAIVGQQGRFEHIMSVDVTCHFVAPMLSICPEQLNFYIKVSGQSLMPLYEKLILTNESSLSLSMELAVVQPFFLCEAPGAHSSATTKFLEVHYRGHPQTDMVKVHAEVHFPNLHFSSTTVDFGCVLNYTETHRQIQITNCSPLPVSYHWTFLDDQKHRTIRTTKMLESLSPRPGADEQSNAQSTVHVFDIRPNYGHLQPGDRQEVTLCFYGHQNVCGEVLAQCHVKEGPTYKIKLRGEASVISYSLDSTHVDFGLLLFDHEGEAHMILRNTGKMGFEFGITDPEREDEADEEAGEEMKALEEAEQQPDARQQKDDEQNKKRQEVRPGQAVVIPPTGYIEGGAEQCLRVLYLPGVPEVFEKQLELKVAHLPPQDITLTGEAVFSRISLNLPRHLSEEGYSDVVQRARAAVDADRDREELRHGMTTEGEVTTEAVCTLTYEEQLHMEIERTLVKENALAVTASLLELSDSQDSSRKWHKLSKALLPEYVLDFGYVIPCTVPSHTVNVTNTGSVAVSFHADRKPLTGTGFYAEFKRVKNLPCGETQTFTVKFDPHGANLKMGDTSVVMPIQVTGGAVVQVRLCVVVTEPAVTVSTDTLHFDAVQCGMCQMRTIQLFNCQSVPCYWSIVDEVKPFRKVDKFLPLHKRKKILREQRPPPVIFTMIPSSGMLSPGERVNVQIKFSPAEGHAYRRRLVVRVADSTQLMYITVKGQGEEPQLEFCPSVLELGPCLLCSTEVEAEVTVKNPCPFPIEFYSLELDTQYLEEEKILRLMQGYDENSKLLLPPRVPGESLPKELLDYYEEYCSQLNDDVISEITKEGSSTRLGQLEMTPVCKAIARHMCVDLSPEGLAARNRRGIAIIVYGAPLTGKSSTAAALACHYEGACLSVDAVVTDVLMNGTSPVSQTSRQIYDSAAAQYAERKAEEAAQAAEETTKPGPAADLEASAPASHAVVEPSKDGCSRNDSTAPQDAEYKHFALCLGGDVTTLSNLFPEQLLVDILAERFQLSDCRHGVVICDLESVYTQSPASTLQVVLKALNNRKHIYVVNLSDSYAALKAQERAQRETEEALEEEKADREEEWLLELDDEEYDALPEEQKERIFQQHRGKLKQKKLSSSVLSSCDNSKESPSSLDELHSQFSVYEQTQEKVVHILQHWDRAQGLLLVPVPGEEEPLVSKDATTEKQTPIGKRSKKANSKAMSPVASQVAPSAEAGDKVSPQDIIPHIVLNVTGKDHPSATELLKGSSLPLLDEVLDDLGLGPSGPPIPPPTTFSMVPFPQNRQQSESKLCCDCFTLLGPSRADKQDVEKKDSEEEAAATPSKVRGKGSIKESAVTKDQDKKVPKSRRSKRRTPLPVPSTTEGAESTQQDQHQETLELKRNQSLTKFRWVVPANGEVVLKMQFYSDSPGKFEQTLNFELLGTQRHYQLLCRGTCTYPISEDYNGSQQDDYMRMCQLGTAVEAKWRTAGLNTSVAARGQLPTTEETHAPSSLSP
ncbi:LOW QUALITY PROTEIN: hydrocephalus-inducing protein homolog [Symphorus nematophorus]